jgi:hypothetical protein
MKKFILAISVIVGFSVIANALPINECKTDIYFGNGVWNSPEDAEKSQNILQKIINREIIKGDPALQAKYGEVKLQYNWSADKNYDLAETFYQLKEAGQLSRWMFYQLLDALETRTLSDASGEDIRTMRDKLIEAISSVEQNNVDVMLKKYYDESFQYSHRVLLVSHSQGNLFANRVYDSIDPSDYRNYFANVQVASPASSVHANNGTYITGWIDPVINPIPGSMESNADLDGFGGHAFVAAYLDSSDTYTKIVKAIKAQLDVLDTIDSQWKIVQKPNRCDGCKNFTAKVEHRFDGSIKLDDAVLPYRMDKFKLYQVDGRYVLASCGGIKIENLEDDDESKICSRLAGVNEAIPKMKTLIDGVCIGIVDSDIEYMFDRDLKQLTVGSIGDNYWGGECKEYKRYITLLVENSEKLKSFKITEVGFDDWIDLRINSKVFYQSPYQLPPNCELGTSFITHPHIELKQEIQEGLNQMKMKVVVTGGGEGWFKVQLD